MHSPQGMISHQEEQFTDAATKGGLRDVSCVPLHQPLSNHEQILAFFELLQQEEEDKRMSFSDVTSHQEKKKVLFQS